VCASVSYFSRDAGAVQRRSHKKVRRQLVPSLIGCYRPSRLPKEVVEEVDHDECRDISRIGFVSHERFVLPAGTSDAISTQSFNLWLTLRDLSWPPIG